MRARRSAYEPAGAGFALMPVVQRRGRLSTPPRRSRLAAIVSALVHATLVAALLLLKAGAPPGEEQNAPSFAVQFEDAAPTAASTPPGSEPRVSLGEPDQPPPPPTEAAESAPPPPHLHYGAARQPHASSRPSNPFANIVPFDLSPSQHARSAATSRSRSLDLSAGPVVREGKLTDSITHAPGEHVSGDYDAIIQAFVEAHREQIQESLREAQAGQAVLQVTIARDGHVLRLHLLQPSRSALLDAAWMGFFRDYRLPPLSADIPGDSYTFAYELDYSIIYGPPPR